MSFASTPPAPVAVVPAVGVAVPAAGTRAQAMLAMLLGIVIVGFVGFSHVEVVHNAAHDTRHSNGFPCH